jgi:hypothetical protein
MSIEKTVTIKISEKLLNEIKELAKKDNPAYEEGFIAEDWAGGNFDDAHSLGMRHGEIDLAQRIIESIVETT